METTLTQSQIAVIQPSGHVNAATVDELQSQLNNAVAYQERILVDLHKVESLDSAGLMALVATQRKAQELKCRFSLCSVSPAIRIIFELTQLDRVFEIFDNRAAFEAAII